MEAKYECATTLTDNDNTWFDLIQNVVFLGMILKSTNMQPSEHGGEQETYWNLSKLLKMQIRCATHHYVTNALCP
jgi:hypothetical protein